MRYTDRIYSNFVSDREPKLFITIEPRLFKKPMTDPVCIDYCNRLLKLVNTQLFNKRFKRKEQYLEGFAVLEHTYKGAPHVHMLVLNNLQVEDVREAFEKNSSRFKHTIDTSTAADRAQLRRSYQNGIPGSLIKEVAVDKYIREVPIFAQDAEGRGGINVKPITDTPEDHDRVIGYLQKEYRGFMLLGAEGLIPYEDVGRTLAV
jgi:hypothetical protein